MRTDSRTTSALSRVKRLAALAIGAASLTLLGGCYGAYSYTYASPAYCAPAPVYYSSCAPAYVVVDRPYCPPPRAYYGPRYHGGSGHHHHSYRSGW